MFVIRRLYRDAGTQKKMHQSGDERLISVTLSEAKSPISVSFWITQCRKKEMKGVSKDTSKRIQNKWGQVFIEHFVIFLAVSLRCQTLGNFFFCFVCLFYLFIYSLAPTNTLILVSMRKSIPLTKKFAAGTDAVMDLPHRAMGSRQKQIGTGFVFVFFIHIEVTRDTTCCCETWIK